MSCRKNNISFIFFFSSSTITTIFPLDKSLIICEIEENCFHLLRALNTYLAKMSISILNLSPTAENFKFVFSHVKGTILTSKFSLSTLLTVKETPSIQIEHLFVKYLDKSKISKSLKSKNLYHFLYH